MGSLLGSAVEGAIVGGVGAIPGVGLVETVIAGGVGAAANSAISQKIDEGTIDGQKVVEDGLVGVVAAGVFYGIGQTVKAIKGNSTLGIKEQYALDQMLTSLVTGATSSVLTVVGIKTGEDLFKELLTILLPIYKGSNEGTALEYLRGIYDKLTTECDM